MVRTPGSEKSSTQPMVAASFWRGWVSLVRPAARKAKANTTWRTQMITFMVTTPQT
jgi:hypothetical protein